MDENSLRREIKYLRELEYQSYKMSEEKGDILHGYSYRANLKSLYESYQRILDGIRNAKSD